VVFVPVVDDFDAGSLSEYLAYALQVRFSGKLEIDGLGVSAEHGHADSGRSDFDFLVVKYLFGFLNHLYLFLVVAAVFDGAVVREKIEGYLMRKHLFPGRAALEQVAGLVFQLLHGLGASA